MRGTEVDEKIQGQLQLKIKCQWILMLMAFGLAIGF